MSVIQQNVNQSRPDKIGKFLTSLAVSTELSVMVERIWTLIGPDVSWAWWKAGEIKWPERPTNRSYKSSFFLDCPKLTTKQKKMKGKKISCDITYYDVKGKKNFVMNYLAFQTFFLNIFDNLNASWLVNFSIFNYCEIIIELQYLFRCARSS